MCNLTLVNFVCVCVMKLLDAKKPLVGSFQEQQGVIPMSANCPSIAIMEVSENMRAKIYSVLCKLGKEYTLHPNFQIYH